MSKDLVGESWKGLQTRGARDKQMKDGRTERGRTTLEECQFDLPNKHQDLEGRIPYEGEPDAQLLEDAPPAL